MWRFLVRNQKTLMKEKCLGKDRKVVPYKHVHQFSLPPPKMGGSTRNVRMPPPFPKATPRYKWCDMLKAVTTRSSKHLEHHGGFRASCWWVLLVLSFKRQESKVDANGRLLQIWCSSTWESKGTPLPKPPNQELRPWRRAFGAEDGTPSQPISSLVFFLFGRKITQGLFEKDESFTQGPQWEGGKNTKKISPHP